MKHLSGQAAATVLFVILLLPFLTSIVEAQENFKVQETIIKVYRDGSVHITQTLTVDERALFYWQQNTK